MTLCEASRGFVSPAISADHDGRCGFRPSWGRA